MTRLKAGVVGFPVKHSVSPAMQQAAFDHLGLPVEYRAWEVRPEDLEAFVGRLRAGGWLGVNVTIPHKETVVPLLDELAPEAVAVGAVNTVVAAGGRLTGHNTDVAGFLAGLPPGQDFAGARALILGAGGAAAAVLFGLLGLGLAEVGVFNRRPQRAERLVRRFSARGPATRLRAIAEDELCEYARACVLVINCTPVGTAGTPLAGQMPLAPECLAPGSFAYDLVYNPPETPWLRAVRERGVRPITGLTMLVHQGAAAFRLWTGREAPVGVMLEAARRALAEFDDASVSDGGRVPR